MKTKFKTVVYLFILVVLSNKLSAQTGSLMFYGSVNYNHAKDSDVSSQFSMNPLGVGYQFDDHVVAGLNFATTIAENKNNDVTSRHYEIGPFYSYAWQLADHFLIIAQTDAHYQWGETAVDTQISQNYSGYLLRAYPIVAVLLGKGWALKAKFGEISYNHTNTNGTNFISGINGNTMGIGVSKNIMLKKNKI
ncbi:hypothetical protein AR687_11045 [Flavobacteriaceae bacterium CRH]|nr:hypothetical protein AR687_11045 [Flavobacteriaceae bacterium CRH]